MNLETTIPNTIKEQKQEELKSSDQLMLSELISKLEAVKNKELPLFIDIMNKRPKGINSWRGCYAKLAIQTKDFGYYDTYGSEGKTEHIKSYKQKTIGKENPTVKEWIVILKKIIGKTFTGYKGGNFTMEKNTPVYLAEYSNASFKIDDKELDTKNYTNYKNVFFVDVKEQDKKVILVTKIEED